MLTVYFGILTIALVQISVGQYISLDEIDGLFKDDNCIEGRIVHTPTGGIIKANNKIQLMPENFVQISTRSPTTTEMLSAENLSKDVRNCLTVVNDICQYNQISSEYSILKEAGLPHDRTFYAQLLLGNEVYLAEGKSKKNAYYELASKAIKTTKYKEPPERKKKFEEKSTELQTPSVQLNNIAGKLGIKVEYINTNGDVIDEHDLDLKSPTYYSLDHSSKSYMEKLNASIKHDFKVTPRVGNEVADTQGPFSIIVKIGDKTFKGEGLSKQSARHAAANKALSYFKNLSIKNARECDSEGLICNKLSIKTPISIITEYAQQNNLKISFSLIDQTGPAHKNEFTMACSMGHMITHGIAGSKKAAKHKAAEKILNKLQELGLPTSNTIQVQSLNSQKKNKRKKKKKKGILEDAKNYMGNAISSLYHSISDSGESDDSHSSNEYSTNNDNNKDSKEEDTHSSKGQLLSLTKSIGLDAQFSTYFNGTGYISLVTLDAEMPQICYDMGKTWEESENTVSLHAIKFLKDVGLDNIIIPIKSTATNKPIFQFPKKTPLGTIKKEEL